MRWLVWTTNQKQAAALLAITIEKPISKFDSFHINWNYSRRKTYTFLFCTCVCMCACARVCSANTIRCIKNSWLEWKKNQAYKKSACITVCFDIGVKCCEKRREKQEFALVLCEFALDGITQSDKTIEAFLLLLLLLLCLFALYWLLKELHFCSVCVV